MMNALSTGRLVIKAVGGMLTFLCCISVGQVAEPLAVFSCTERLERDWPQTMVTYHLTTGRTADEARQLAGGASLPSIESHGLVRLASAFHPEDVRLVDAEGNELPFQIWKVTRDDDGRVVSARLSFMAALESDGSYEYQLISGESTAGVINPVRLLEGDNFLTLDNGIVAVRLPPLGEHVFPEGMRFGSNHQEMVGAFGAQQEHGVVPGPLQGIKLKSGTWVGGSYFWIDKPEASPIVESYTSRISEQGALFTEATVRYAFSNGGYYQFKIRVSPDDAAVRVDEQFDLGRTGRTQHWRDVSPEDPRVHFSLSSGWQNNGWRPTHVYWERQPYGNAVKPGNTPLETVLAERPGFNFDDKKFGTHELPYDEDNAGIVFGVEPWAVYGNYVFYCGLINGTDVEQSDSPPFLGLMPVHAGNWRGDGPYNLKWLTTYANGDISYNLPLVVFPHPDRVTHTGEYDDQMPYTLGRRQWVLFGGPMRSLQDLQDHRVNDGYINLNDYKDWVLEWPSDASVGYPRLFFDPEQLDDLTRNLDGHPFRGEIENWLYLQDDSRRAASLFAKITEDKGFWTSALGQIKAGLGYWFSLWRQAHATGQWITEAEELLASDHVTEEQTAKLRMQLAALCYMVSEPDFNPRGSMVHLGNPNMAIVRTLPLLYGAALIPDHPQAENWLDMAEAFVAYKFGSNAAPGGGWSELFTYYDASAPALIHAANILSEAGRLEETTRAQAVAVGSVPLRFLPTPDPRFDGARRPPAWGHEGRLLAGQWLPAAHLARANAEPLADALLWGWKAAGFDMGHHDKQFNKRCSLYASNVLTGTDTVPSAEIASHWTPGMGAVLRGHAGDTNETYLSYRQGYLISHCDDNQGDFVLYAKGAPLIDMSVMAYPLHQHEPYINMNLNFGWYSYPRLQAQDNASDVRQGANSRNLIGAWNPSSDIHSHYFSKHLDYLRGRADYPPHRWTRQIMFVKGDTASGPNYFVFRDSQDALTEDPKDLVKWWWNVRTIGTSDQVQSNPQGFRYASEFGTELDVRVLQPAHVAVESRQAGREHRDTKETLTLTALGPVAAEHDIMVALYPMLAAEEPPIYEHVQDGVVKIETSEGTDWIFMNREPFSFEQGEVAFRGLAGTIRIREETVVLHIAEGPASVRYAEVTLQSDVPATKVVPKDKIGEKQVESIPSPVYSIKLEAPERAAEDVAPGVQKAHEGQKTIFTFSADEEFAFENEDVVFRGREGCIIVDNEKQTARLILLSGNRIGYRQHQVWNGTGPFDLTFSHDRISGRHEGRGRILNMTHPVGIDKMTTVLVDGIPYLPGSSVTTDPAIAGRAGNADRSAVTTLVLPLLDGAHRLDVRNLSQPPVFTNWEAW